MGKEPLEKQLLGLLQEKNVIYCCKQHLGLFFCFSNLVLALYWRNITEKKIILSCSITTFDSCHSFGSLFLIYSEAKSLPLWRRIICWRNFILEFTVGTLWFSSSYFISFQFHRCDTLEGQLSYVWKADKKVNNAKQKGRRSILLLHDIFLPHFKAAETLPTYQNSLEKQFWPYGNRPYMVLAICISTIWPALSVK